MVRSPLEPARHRGADDDASHPPRRRRTDGLVVRLWQRIHDLAFYPNPHRNWFVVGVRADGGPSLRESRLPELSDAAGLVSALVALLVRVRPGIYGRGPCGPGVLARAY